MRLFTPPSAPLPGPVNGKHRTQRNPHAAPPPTVFNPYPGPQVKSLVASQHLSSSGAESGVYSRGSPALERVRSVGVRVLEASRSHVRTELQKLETELTVRCCGEFLYLGGGGGGAAEA